MELKAIFGILAFLFSAAAYIPYARSILRSKARPTMSSWISWMIMDTAILAGMIAQKEFSFQIAAYIVGCAAIIGTNLYVRASLGWTLLDSGCIVLVLAAVGLWAKSGDADIAIVFSLGAMVMGSIPLFINALRDPSREPILPWLLNWAGAGCGFLAITNWTLAGALSPMVFLALSTSFNILVLRQLLPRKATI